MLYPSGPNRSVLTPVAAATPSEVVERGGVRSPGRRRAGGASMTTPTASVTSCFIAHNQATGAADGEGDDGLGAVPCNRGP